MKWVSALSTRASLEGAVGEVVEHIQARFSGQPDLGLLFISSAFASELPRLLPLLQEALPIPALIGCSGGGVIGMSPDDLALEVEGKPALSLSVASLPGVKVHSFHLPSGALPDLDSPPGNWIDLIGVDPADNPQFILMADPFASGINDLLQGLDFAYPGAVKVGGLASANGLNRSSGLFCDRTLHQEGIVGVALCGHVVLDAIVAQGCRPIGNPYRVAEAERNILLRLEDPDSNNELRPPLEILQELFQILSEEDRSLAQHSLFIGVAQDGFKLTLEHGDFLIRNLLGVDPKAGAIAIGDRIRPGQRVQFHLRDARTSAEDLETLLSRYQLQSQFQTASPVGALLFSCMGRGEGLYKEPNFDSRLFNRFLDQVPLSGFFCGGEIGPIGGTTFLHGYTSVFGICRQP
ncbi:MAG: FIST C-terminal domain-containing protein [Cyanobacteria bacterium Co-bin8]|nr:FIST C-terminal domain-containing protein [Cyanobacteria bacterium Co-bin8]